METYTEEIHAECLLEMLEQKSPCSHCPITFLNKTYCYNSRCHICRSFVNTPELFGCPCHMLGFHEAIKRTWLALEEKGYLD